MKKIKTLLIANRGEIAVRIIKTAKSLDIKTISIYTPADAASLHVSQADECVLLKGDDSRAYTDGEQIIDIAKRKHADAVIPGYGFLSENADFARKVGEAGLVWCGPSPEAIEAFGVKHVARYLAEKAGVPIVPGTKGLVETQDEAVNQSEKLGYPVMLKATGGGGGMGLVTCQNAKEVRKGFEKVRSRGEQLFKNPGLFIERYYPASRHIEVQIFGNGQGSAIHFGERECSIQRRHQKVIEECPSPFVESHEGLRDKLGSAAVALAQSVKYGSAGTVEYLVDDQTGDFFFLEMNTRLQVEHGITELCHDVDLVKLMLEQADAQLVGDGGISEDDLRKMQPSLPKGCAIEARIYAENPVRDYAPSPGLLQKVQWAKLEGSRIDTFAFTGSTISPHYDPLIAKVMYHAETRPKAIEGMQTLLCDSKICGPPTNLAFLAAIVSDDRFIAGDTLTNFLQDFTFTPSAIDVVSAGAYTLIQDLPGRPTVGMGICHGGAMDAVALSIGNMLVGNERGKEGLEITLQGPELRFLGKGVVALTGAAIDATLDGDPFPMWTRKHIKAGQRLKIGRTTGAGCRAYLAVFGGFPSIAAYFGSKSTSPVVAIGGMQGRALAPGDLLSIVDDIPSSLNGHPSVPETLQPTYTNAWEVMTMAGPHDVDYFTPDFLKTLYNTEWKVSHNASRSAIRLIGPQPEWARKNGAEGGAHPSNVVEYGYPLYGLNWTGDDPAILVPDGPNFGGFVCSNTVVSADYWKVGQLKVGDTLRFRDVSLETAQRCRMANDKYLDGIEEGIKTGDFEAVVPLESQSSSSSASGPSILTDRAAEAGIPRVRYRQGGDQHLIICYAQDTDHFDINNRVRVTALEKALTSPTTPSWLRTALTNTVGCCNTLTLYYTNPSLNRHSLLTHLQTLEPTLGTLHSTLIPCRKITLPLTFHSRAQDAANARYQATQRPYAPYLPSNFSFVASNNALTPSQLQQNFLTASFLTIFVGFYCGLPDAIPIDPRHRIFAPKTNPSRVHTPAGTVGLGGGAIAIYPVDSPGGYQMCGRTVPCWDTYGWKRGFARERPWVFREWDLIQFREASEGEVDAALEEWERGAYEFAWEDGVVDMGAHNRLLGEIREEVRGLRERQGSAQEEMVRVEERDWERSRELRERERVDEGTVEALVADPAVTVVDAPVDANVWKVQVADGDDVPPDGVLVILEAMKMEINVCVPADVEGGAKVEKVLVKPGDAVKAGGRVALLRKAV